MLAGPILMVVVSAILFGAATPVSKILLVELPPFQLAGLLYLGAAIAVAPAVLRSGGLALPPRSDRKNRARLAGAVLFGGVLGPVTLLFALRMADAATVSLWLNMELVATAVLGVILFRDHLSRLGWVGVLVAFLASTMLTDGASTSGVVAGLLVLGACVCWGLDNHFTALIDGITPSQSTLWKGIVAGAVNLSAGLALSPLSASVTVLLLALLVGALSYGASIVLYIRAAQQMGATRAQVVFACAPAFGVALSVIFLEEQFGALQMLSALLFVVAVVLLLIESHAHEHGHASMFHEHSHRHDDGHHDHGHPGLPGWTRHSHPHHHEPQVHHHPHLPDLHHRHEHKPSGD